MGLLPTDPPLARDNSTISKPKIHTMPLQTVHVIQKLLCGIFESPRPDLRGVTSDVVPRLSFRQNREHSAFH